METRHYTDAKARRPRLAEAYMLELIDYGGVRVPRGWAWQKLLEVAKAQGHANPRAMADRWMQGYDLRQELKRGKS